MRALWIGVVAVVWLALLPGAGRADPLRVATTTPDLASIVESVGGEDVEVTAFARGGQDPHFVEPRPSFVRLLSRADLFVQVGLQLEVGWVPALVRSSRNSRVQAGAEGFLDASRGIPLLGVLTRTVDRSMGDVHASGNPHYLADPVNGIRVARAVRDRLIALRADQTAAFRERTAAFEAIVAERLVGEAAVARHGADAVVAALLEDRIHALVAGESLGGWLGTMRPHAGAAVVADHNLWPYLAKRFGLEVVAFLEPFPGIAPTTRHLVEVAEQMKTSQIRVILSVAYFHPRYAMKVGQAAGATVVEMAEQVGARDGVDDYLSMVDWNVRSVADAL